MCAPRKSSLDPACEPGCRTAGKNSWATPARLRGKDDGSAPHAWGRPGAWLCHAAGRPPSDRSDVYDLEFEGKGHSDRCVQSRGNAPRCHRLFNQTRSSSHRGNCQVRAYRKLEYRKSSSAIIIRSKSDVAQLALATHDAQQECAARSDLLLATGRTQLNLERTQMLALGAEDMHGEKINQALSLCVRKAILPPPALLC